MNDSIGNNSTPSLGIVPEERKAVLATLELATTLGHFRQRLDRMEDATNILKEAMDKVQGLIPMQAWSFFLVEEMTGDFLCALCGSSQYKERFEREVDALIEDKTFSWAMGRGKAVVIPSALDSSEKLLLHPLVTASGLWGMFVGVPTPSAELGSMGMSLLSIVFFSCASMLESFTLYRKLQQANAGLGQQVEERTRELETMNNSLTLEVAERKQVEQTLRRTLTEKEAYKQHLEAIFSSIQDALIIVDLKGVVQNLNAAAEKLLGVSAREAVRRHYSELKFPCTKAFQEILAATLSKGAPVRDLRAVSEDETQVLVLCSTPLIALNGKFVGAIFSGRDITRLAILEKQLRRRHSFSNIIGRSKVMQATFSLLENLAAYDTTVLVTGESGTGKELVAEALHYNGARSNGPLVKINCTALSESLLESELFGHVRGAFTGAVRDRPGRFETAEGGTIFLDEIGDISLRIQVLLLRFLESKEFERVGDDKPRRADVRIVAATNADLSARIRQGTFRADLYYRLNVSHLHLPPLRERREDIPLLVQYFVKRCNRELGTQVSGVDEHAMSALIRSFWPGNVRELKHILEHACVLCREGYVSMGHLPVEFVRQAFAPAPTATETQSTDHGVQVAATPDAQPQGYGRPVLDAQALRNAIGQAGGNKAQAARILGIGRATLYRKLRELNVEK